MGITLGNVLTIISICIAAIGAIFTAKRWSHDNMKEREEDRRRQEAQTAELIKAQKESADQICKTINEHYIEQIQDRGRLDRHDDILKAHENRINRLEDKVDEIRH